MHYPEAMLVDWLGSVRQQKTPSTLLLLLNKSPNQMRAGKMVALYVYFVGFGDLSSEDEMLRQLHDHRNQSVGMATVSAIISRTFINDGLEWRRRAGNAVKPTLSDVAGLMERMEIKK